LASPQTAPDDIDDEIVSFTQNSRWQKLDNLWPLLICSGWIMQYLNDWMDAVQTFFDLVKAGRRNARQVSEAF
jgi:hypothetical protein